MYGQVVRPDSKLGEELEQFIPVRITRISNLNHGVFRFDKNLSFAVMFTNADLEVYGRYGTRAGGAYTGPFMALPDTDYLANKDMSVASLRKAMQKVLALHEARQQKTAAVDAWLAAKLGHEYLGQPIDTSAALRGRRRDECVHCHRIAEEEVGHYFNQSLAVPDRLLWSFPMPDRVGIVCDPDECATVTEVVADSAAARAGLRQGDDILTMAGQPIVSIADVQWVLDQAPDQGDLALEIQRAGKQLALRLTLEDGWRRRDQFAWRYSYNGLKPKLLGIDLVTEYTDTAHKKFGIKPGESAVRIDRMPRGGGVNRAARESGLETGDVIVKVDDQGRQTESEMLAYLLQKKRPGQDVTLTVLRGEERLAFTFALGTVARKRGHDH